jgi:hypothetical protein
VITLELEGSPTVRIAADSHEDELRLRKWLQSAGVHGRLLDAVLDGLDELAA